jgi:hypothetical protein
MGIKNGLAGIDAGPDWRGPVADQIFLPTADGGRCVTDAVRETYRDREHRRALAGEAPVAPENGARFHFELPGPSGLPLRRHARVARGGARSKTSRRCRARAGARWRCATMGVAPGRPGRAVHADLRDARGDEDGRVRPGRLADAVSGQTVTRAARRRRRANARPVRANLYVRVYTKTTA